MPLVACHSIQSLSHNESSKGVFSKNAKSVGKTFLFHEGFFIMLHTHEKEIGVARGHLAKLLRVSNAHSCLSLKDYSLQLVLTLSLKQVPHLFSPTLLSHIKNIGGKCFFIKRTVPPTLRMPLIKKVTDFFLGNNIRLSPESGKKNSNGM